MKNKNITRRRLLKALGTISGAIAIDRFAVSSLFAQPAEEYVNLVFHGVFAFLVREKDIVVLTPKLLGHKYLAGGLISGAKMGAYNKGFYELKGAAVGPKPTIDKQNSLGLSARSQGLKTLNLKNIRSGIVIPFPEKIVPLERFSVDVPNTYKGNAAAEFGLVSGGVPSVQCFVYRMDSSESLSLRPFGTAAGAQAEPFDTPMNPPPYQHTKNLHLMAAYFHVGDLLCQLDVMQMKHSFKSLTSMVQGLDLRMTPSCPAPSFIEDELPPGVTGDEVGLNADKHALNPGWGQGHNCGGTNFFVTDAEKIDIPFM